MSSQRDYTSYSFLTTILVIAAMAGLSQLPRFKLGSLTFKRTNILADIIKQEESPELLEADQYFDTTFLNEAAAMKVIDSATRSAERDTLSLPEAKLEEWNIATDTPAAAPILLTKPAGADQNVVPIELFSPDAMMRFNRALTRGAAGRPVRIAVLGDSFIEGDIITADLREQLQNLCGGRGVGFVPFASPLAKFRGTVLHSFSNWDIYNIRDRAQIPAAIKDRFFVSGFVCIPQEGATTRLQGVTFRKHINQAGTARLVFTNRNNTRLNVVINDSVSRLFAPEPSEHVQQIVINAPVHSISVTLNRTDGFTGYGIVLEDAGGVSVDNYSIRGNSGMALFETNSFVNQQIGQMLGYDLIVLQYRPERHVARRAQIRTPIRRPSRGSSAIVQQCFPGASILVMGVGDRSTLRDGQFVTMPAVKGMIDAQRKAAEAAGVAFWNTFDAMGGENSMVNFVQKKWAAQDHTHIRYPGGKYIAQRFATALVYDAQQHPGDGDEPMPLYHSPAADTGKNAFPAGWEHEGTEQNPAESGTETEAGTAATDRERGQTDQNTARNGNGQRTGTGTEAGAETGTGTGTITRNRCNCGYKCRGGSHPGQPGCLRHARYDKDPS
ncbi:MAG: hypothetical protein ACLTZY_01250 [Alistipes indistinctus]